MAEAGEMVLEGRGLKKIYGNGTTEVTVLRGLDLTVHASEFVALLGPSGCGKSTLLNILGLMDEPTSGEVRYEGKLVSAMTEPERCALRNRALGFVFQFDSLMPEFTVLENVVMPARIGNQDLEAAARRGLELLRGLGLEGLQGRFPSQLSGGERQRVALCRSLVNGPKLLLADEPTGNLDRSNGELVFKDLKELARLSGAAVLMVTRNEEAAGYATRVVRMLDGMVINGGGDS